MRAIDVHVHPPTVEYLAESGGPFFANAFGVSKKLETFDSLKKTFTDAGVQKAVLLAWDAETHSTRPRTRNEYVADIVKQYPDFFIGFGSVDPWKGQKAITELELFKSSYGFKGVKFHPPAQGFSPADPRFFPMWDLIQEQELVVLSEDSYNLCEGGKGGFGYLNRSGKARRTGKKHSEESKKKMGHPGNSFTKGKKLSEEHKAKMATSMSEVFKGIPKSDEHKKRISEAIKQKWQERRGYSSSGKT